MSKNNAKETYLVPPKGHISVKNMWRYSQVVQRYRTRGAPFPLHKAPRMPQNTLWHKIITYEKLFWNNYFWKITNFTRNFWKKSFFPGDFEGVDSLKNNEK